MNPIKWLLGPSLYSKSATTTKALLYWLIGKPIDSGGAIAVAAGEASIDEQILVVQQLAEAIGYQEAAVKEVSQMLEENNDTIARLNQQGEMLAKDPENEEAALGVLIELEAYEAMSPTLESKLQTATANFEQGKESLKEQQLVLKKMQIQQRSNEAQSRINQALEMATSKMNGVELTSSRTLDRAKNAIERRGNIAQGVSEANRSIGATDRKVAQLTAADRLARFRQSTPQITEAK
jgi:phage shock protein A